VLEVNKPPRGGLNRESRVRRDAKSP